MRLKYGTLLREKANFVLPKINNIKTEFGLGSHKELQSFYPEVVEEIKGFAKWIKNKPNYLIKPAGWTPG
ncbi:hypothetical protein QQ020_13265 [Fulvivirgaceae bacterium BMA12]|uniref:Uncharacterized protein n=1 Tax=Agaribacillus aureus TaxID=3051825 RepID=A0ABT8L5L4_9BACT|nr:hypothetical protein [Fulvivirgaceae bacterium BMA12]